MTLGQKIVKLRKERNLTQEELGNALNCSRQAIQKWEHDINLPDVYKLKELAKYFNVSVNYFFDDSFDIKCDQKGESDSSDIVEYEPITTKNNKENDNAIVENEGYTSLEINYIKTIIEDFFSSVMYGLDIQDLPLSYSHFNDKIVDYESFISEDKIVFTKIIINEDYLLNYGLTIEMLFDFFKKTILRKCVEDYKNQFPEKVDDLDILINMIESYANGVASGLLYVFFGKDYYIAPVDNIAFHLSRSQIIASFSESDDGCDNDVKNYFNELDIFVDSVGHYQIYLGRKLNDTFYIDYLYNKYYFSSISNKTMGTNDHSSVSFFKSLISFHCNNGYWWLGLILSTVGLILGLLGYIIVIKKDSEDLEAYHSGVLKGVTLFIIFTIILS